MGSAWSAARHELQTLLGDKGVLLVLVGATLFYALFYPLPYRDQAARDVPLVVIDLDRSAASRELTRRLDATEQIQVWAVVQDPAQGEQLLRQGKVGGMVHIPAEFERKLLRGEVSRVGIWGNAAYVLLYSQVATGAGNVGSVYSAEIMAGRLESAGKSPVEFMPLAAPVRLNMHELFNPGGGYGSYVVPAVLVLILQQTLLIAIGMMGAGNLRAQWRAHTGEPPIRGLLLRALLYVGIHWLLTIIVISVVYRFYAFPGAASGPALFSALFSALLSALVLLPFLTACAAFGFMLTACFRKRETVLEVLMLISMPTLFLAGFAWPAEAMPAPLVVLGWLIPSTAGIDVFIRFHQMGASLGEILPAWLWLFGLSVLYFTVSILLTLRHKEPVRV